MLGEFKITLEIPGLLELVRVLDDKNKAMVRLMEVGDNPCEGMCHQMDHQEGKAIDPVAAQQIPAQPVMQNAPMPAQTPASSEVPTETVTYTLDDLARAAMALMDAGGPAELQALLCQFGVEALPQLPQEQYGTFATALRGMGAQI